MSEVAIGPVGQVRPVRVLADLLAGSKVREVLLVLGGAALVGAVAQVSIPVPGSPVPITGQTFAVLLVGAGLGARRAAASLGLYLVAGLAGVPWFAGGASGVHLPTLGYLVGFLLAAPLVGRLAASGADRHVLRTLGLMVAGNVAIYLVGVPWLASAIHVSLAKAVMLGLVPFLIGDAIKALLAAGLLPGTWRLVNR